MKYAPRKHIFFCTNERREDHPLGCCAVKGSAALRMYMKDMLQTHQVFDVQVSASRCLGQCNRGPAAVVYPDAAWYTIQTKDDVERIVEDHLLNGRVVRNLQMQDDPDD